MGAFSALRAQFDPVNSKRKGDQFEIVCKWFLQNDPTYKSLFREVWLWDEWPDSWPQEAGIDLVAKDRHGNLWAIQAKAEHDQVTHAGVAHFIAEASRTDFAYLMLIATTDKIHHIGARTMRETAKPVTIVRLSDLESSEVDWPNSLRRLRPAKPKPKEPWDYQKDAIDDVISGFKKADRGQLIMACGTGKTLTALFIKERLEAKRTLVLVPSLSLLKQTLKEWTASKKVDFDFMAVCSDQTATTEDRYDAALADTTELGIPPTTKPSEIAKFISQRSGPLVVFSTYHSSPQIAKAFKLPRRVPQFDLIIADEAHRCAGPISSDFATVLKPGAIKTKRRLFMTATPRIYSSATTKSAPEARFEYASMDDPDKFGKVFHLLGFGKAIKEGLLTDYQVAVIDVDDATCRDWAKQRVPITLDDKKITDVSWLAGQIGLAKAMRKFDLRRVISFHGRVKRAQEFASAMKEIVDWLPRGQRPSGKLWSEHASGAMSTDKRYRLLQDLKTLRQADRGLLSNARCLAEGIDVPALDGVAFIDPRGSVIDIIQAVGRAIRKTKPEKIGTIVIPVLTAPGQDPDVVLKSSAFKPVWAVVRALRAHDDVLAAQLDSLRMELGRVGGIARLPSKILPLPRTVGPEFAKAFNLKLVELTTSTWESWFGLLRAYGEENGTVRVPFSCEFRGENLGNWASMQRYLYGIDQLEPARARRLEGLLDWSWDYLDEKWEEFLRHLEEFVATNGHALVEKTYKTPEGYPLGSRVSVYRRKAKGERRETLSRIPGWVWNTQDAAWEQCLKAAEQFISENGHSVMPRGIRAGNADLANWASYQRRQYAKGQLAKLRVEKLSAIKGWAWDKEAQEWEIGFAHLLRFGQSNDGNHAVPADCQFEGYPLGAWTRWQRKLYVKGDLHSERRARLSALDGWSWHPKVDLWEVFIEKLQKRVAETGSAAVPDDYCDDNGYPLGRRVVYYRAKRSSLSKQRKQMLDALHGWTWNTRRAKWLGNLAVAERELSSSRKGRNPNASKSWLNQQRYRARQNELDAEQIKALQQAFPDIDWGAPSAE